MQYFGYYAITLGAADYSGSVASQQNLFWSTRGGPNASLVLSDIQSAASNGQKIIIDVSAYFFQGSSLRTDYASQWAALAAAINNSGNADTVVAFYPKDEPSTSVSESDLVTVIATIKSSFPSKAVAVIYNWDGNSNFRAVSSFDWVGIDCYSNGTFHCLTTDYSRAYWALRANLSATQRTIVVPQAGVPASQAGCCNAALSTEGSRLYQMALADPKAIAVVPFIWQSFNDGTDNWVGLADSSQAPLQPLFATMGSKIKNGTFFPSGVVPVFRAYNDSGNDHLFSLSGTEGLSVGYAFESIGFSVYTTPASGTIGLYRCLVLGRHMVSTNAACEGFTTEGQYGYIMGYQVGGTVPLYRFYNPSTNDRFASTSYAEGAGLAYEGILGYVPDVSNP